MTFHKKVFYDSYVSSHTRNLYGERDLITIEKKDFRVWQAYFGKFFPDDKKSAILDLGCGDGGFVYWLCSQGYRNAEGVDISAEQTKHASTLGIKNIQKSEALEFLARHPQKYKVIYARDFLEHFSKTEIVNLMEAIKTSLIPGGIIVGQTVNAESLLWGRLRHGDLTHDLAFTKESIKQLCSVCGFKNTKVFPERPVIHGPSSFVRALMWHGIETALRLYLLSATGAGNGIFTQDFLFVAET